MSSTPVLLVVSGPSGAGKTSLCEALLDKRDSIEPSISYTTRPARGNEVGGRDYHFISSDRFEDIRKSGGFVEWAEVHGHRYGTPVEAIEKAKKQNRDLLFDIDVQGAKQLKETFSSTDLVLVVPPDMRTLEERLRGRDTDPDEVIERRLKAAREELGEYKLFDYILTNRTFEQAASDLKAIYDASRLQTSRRTKQIEQLLKP